ncbi:hypothetical protein ES703_104549 [subsurface metagenome]
MADKIIKGKFFPLDLVKGRKEAKYQELGKTQINVSKICMGCWAIVGDKVWGPQRESDSIGVVYNFYQKVISLEFVGAIFHANDLGYKTGTMLSPESLRKLFFPWLKEYVSLAHKQGKTFWYHCCGNVGKVIEELIEGIKIDAFHSFQDVITPVGDFQKNMGIK